MAKVHIGKKIKEVLDKSNLSVTTFAKRINRSRDVAYKIFDRETINTGQLQKISEVLDHDFFQYLGSDVSVVQEQKQKYGFVTRAEFDNLIKTVERIAMIVETNYKEKKQEEPSKVKPYPRKKSK